MPLKAIVLLFIFSIGSIMETDHLATSITQSPIPLSDSMVCVGGRCEKFLLLNQVMSL